MSKRTAQVESTLQRGISEIIQREIADPRVGLVTITRVKVSGDLRFATVYVSFLEDVEKDSIAYSALKSSLGFIKRRLNDYVKMRYVPYIELVYDDTSKKAERIERLMKKVAADDPAKPV